MIRNTKQREIVLSVIQEAARPLSPAEIHQLAISKQPGIGLKTVYRHVNDLVKNQEVAGVDYPGQPLRYEIIDDRGSRPHLICRDCNRVYDLPIDEPKFEYPELDEFKISGHEVVFFGYCRECLDLKQKA